ncbi:MAG TPA: alpha-amylase family protein [Phycisphaerae bacterium]|nr:alpha-amylase family protein [Phycisphaerae bacterium]
MRRRQIHMDFHTSPFVPDVGSRFDPERMASMLGKANVNSVTCFAKCHHGMFYYNSKVGPRHPSLKFDMLKETLRACHKKDIAVPAYVSVEWDVYAGQTHPEWCIVSPESKVPGPRLDPMPGCSWPTLCVLTGYRRYVADTVKELVSNYDVDGVFFDIVEDLDNCNETALARMREEGVDINDRNSRMMFQRRVMVDFMREFHNLIQEIRRGTPVFYNGRINIAMRESLPYLTHLEVESLPSGFWGYDHFQRIGRHVRTLGKPFLGMTARFHKSWADFGTLKNESAMEYECLTAVAHGGGCSIGDQMHPRGTLEPATYEIIGRIYEKVRDLEPWSEDATPVAQVGVLSLLTNPAFPKEEATAADTGATAMLNETHHLFDLLDEQSRFEDYDLLILPDQIAPDAKLLKRLKQYLAQGGRILASYKSLLDERAGRFALPALHVEYKSSLDHCPFYIRLEKDFGRDIPAIDYCMYEAGLRVRATGKATVGATVIEPYFNRTVNHFCSHFQTPPARSTRDPVVVLTGRTAYINAPIFGAYARNGNLIYRQIVSACIERLLPQRVVRTSLPSCGRVSVLEQKVGRERRRIVHLLNYPTTRRFGTLEVIEEPLPLNDVAVELACPARVKSVGCVPGRQPLPFAQAGGIARFVLPQMLGHQAICVTM